MKAFFLFLKDHPTWVVILGLLILLFLSRECRKPCPEGTTTTITKTDTVHEIKTVVETKYIPKYTPVYIDTSEVHEVIIDTLAILKQYLTKNIYKRQLINDSNAVINIQDTVWRNQLWGGKVDAKFFTHYKTVTITKETTIQQKLRNKVFVGFMLGVNMNDSKLITSPQLMLLTKKDHLYGVGYDLMSKSPSVNMGWKIRLSKK